jgi:predicted phosphoadenosine phosphosulfate sulfurtransferase
MEEKGRRTQVLILFSGIKDISFMMMMMIDTADKTVHRQMAVQMIKV